MTATIHERKEEVHIIKAIGRDLPPVKVDELISKLEDWAKHIGKVEKLMSERIEDYNSNVF